MVMNKKNFVYLNNFNFLFCLFLNIGDTMAAISRRKSTASGIEVMLWFVALPLMVISVR